MTPAASATATAMWSCTRALSRINTQLGSCWSHGSTGLYALIAGSTEFVKKSYKSTDDYPGGGFVSFQSISPPSAISTIKLVATPLQAST